MREQIAIGALLISFGIAIGMLTTPICLKIGEIRQLKSELMAPDGFDFALGAIVVSGLVALSVSVLCD